MSTQVPPGRESQARAAADRIAILAARQVVAKKKAALAGDAPQGKAKGRSESTTAIAAVVILFGLLAVMIFTGKP